MRTKDVEILGISRKKNNENEEKKFIRKGKEETN